MRKHATLLAILVAVAAVTALLVQPEPAPPVGASSPPTTAPASPAPDRTFVPRRAPVSPRAEVAEAPAAPPPQLPAPVDAEETAALLSAVLDREPDDPDWSRSTELAIAEVIERNAEGSQVLALDCRATLCRIEVAHVSASVQHGFLGRVLPFSPFDGPGNAQPIVDPDRPDDHRTIIYLGRKDHDFPI